jgi:hypothetical protein
MSHQNARLTFLRLIELHDGQWGWSQFERAFPPGWFIDEAADRTAKQILDAMEANGLVARNGAEPQGKDVLAGKGSERLREAVVGLTNAQD